MTYGRGLLVHRLRVAGRPVAHVAKELGVCPDGARTRWVAWLRLRPRYLAGGEGDVPVGAVGFHVPAVAEGMRAGDEDPSHLRGDVGVEDDPPVPHA
jgi:hypothetical protein